MPDPINIFGLNIPSVTLFNTRKNTSVILLFCLLAVILRFFTFFPSVIDHDESTYLEIARMLLNGKTLYIDMIDIKPPGIFLILAGFQAVFGYSVFVVRLLVSVWIGFTAFMVYLTGKKLTGDQRAAIAAGVIYIFFISTWSFYGISITPEIFFNLFTVSALYVLIKKQNLSKYFLAGLIAGMGFIVKYLVLFDFAAIVAFVLIIEIRKSKLGILPAVFSLLLAGTGFLLPFAITNLWYYLNGHFDALYNIVYLAPSRYPAAFDPWKMLKFILDFHLRFLPLLIFYYYALFTKDLKGKDISLMRQLGITWSVMALVAVILAGKTFGHYTIQLMLPLSLVAGMFFHSENRLPVKLAKLFSGNTGVVILAMLISGVAAMKLEYVFRKDVPREIAVYLEPRLKKDDVIYTGNYHHIIYYLLKKDSPTKYIHRTLLIGQNHIKALDIHVDQEIQHIIDQNPVYIIINQDYPAGKLKDFIEGNYVVEKIFDEKVKLYKRIQDLGSRIYNLKS